MEHNCIRSHIQMPRFLLKRFENHNHYFYYYDVQKEFIGNGGHAKSFYSEKGYYSFTTEKFLNCIETPFSNFISEIECKNYDMTFSVSTKMDMIVKRFIYAIIARSKPIVSSMNRNALLFEYLPNQAQHDYVVETCIGLAEKHMLLSDFFVTIAFNISSTPFILPMAGLYNFLFKGIKTAFLPVSPKLAIALVHNNGHETYINDGVAKMLLVEKDADALWLNQHAFSLQKEAGYGFVVCPEKTALEECIN